MSDLAMIDFASYIAAPDCMLRFYVKAKQPITQPLSSFLFCNMQVCEYSDCQEH